MGHHHHHHETDRLSDRKLLIAVAINLILTVAQIIGGIFSGSLALLADALHNAGDAAALGIALIARRIGHRPADAFKTFGYKRAEIIAALINLVTLILTGLFLLYEAVQRLIHPEPIAGWLVIIVAGVALVIDIATALLTYRAAKHSVNIKAAFLHNISDALASVGVICAGSLILLYGWLWIDGALTLLIAGYIVWQALHLFPSTLHILMEGTPPHLTLSEVSAALETLEGVQNVHHMHIWQLDEHQSALEAHIVTSASDLHHLQSIKAAIKHMLFERFAISHSTLEFEHSGENCVSAHTDFVEGLSAGPTHHHP